MCFTLQKVQEAAGTVLYCTVHEFYTVVRYFTLIYNSIRRQQGTKQKCTNNLHIDVVLYFTAVSMGCRYCTILCICHTQGSDSLLQGWARYCTVLYISFTQWSGNLLYSSLNWLQVLYYTVHMSYTGIK